MPLTERCIKAKFCVIFLTLVSTSIALAAIQSTCKTNGDVVLTFDLGPGPYTGKLLDELFTHKISVAFHFSTESFRNLTLTEYVRRAQLEGHTVGIFVPETSLWMETDELPETDPAFTAHVIQQVTTASNWITSVTGSTPHYVRFGSKRQLSAHLEKIIEQELGLTITKPGVDIMDESNKIDSSWSSLTKGLLQATPQSNSFILRQRDTSFNCAGRIGRIIEFVRSKGFRIVPLPQCVPPRQSS